MDKILIIDDSIPFLADVEILLKKNFEILTADSGKKGLHILRKEKVSAVLLDLKLPDINGIDVLQKIHRDIDASLPIIIITDYGNIPIAVKAMQMGAKDFIQKDFNRELLCKKIIDALERRSMEFSFKTFKSSIDNLYEEFIFSSQALKKIDFEISRQAMHDEHILLIGETGVGKDLIAHEIHKRSKRYKELFLPVPLHTFNQTLLESELFGHEKGAYSGADELKIGKFEAANKGTLYFPEISEITENMQLKLLQFFQYKEISHVGQSGKTKLDVKIILATNKDPMQLMNEGKFRSDFYYRINAITIKIPPLRERKEDIPILINHFLKKFSALYVRKDISISEEAINMLQNYIWKGNVRELENVIRNLVIYSKDGETISKNFITEVYPVTSREKEDHEANINNNYKLEEQKFKKQYFNNLLNQTNGNKTKTAEIAGITRQGLAKILKELGLE